MIKYTLILLINNTLFKKLILTLKINSFIQSSRWFAGGLVGGCCRCFVKSYRIGGRYNAEGLHALKSFLLLLLPSAGAVRSGVLALVLVQIVGAGSDLPGITSRIFCGSRADRCSNSARIIGADQWRADRRQIFGGSLALCTCSLCKCSARLLVASRFPVRGSDRVTAKDRRASDCWSAGAG